MDEKTLNLILEKKEKIVKYEIIINTVKEKIQKLKQEIEALELADQHIEKPILDYSESVEG